MGNTETYKLQGMKSEFLPDPINQAVFDALAHEYTLPRMKFKDCHDNQRL